MLDNNITPQNLQNTTVSIVVRTANEQRLGLLADSISSIVNNDYRPIEIIIVAQSQNQSFIQKVYDLAEDIIDDHLSYKVVINPTAEDQRAKNLNLGMQSASGRFIGFLDDDDIFFPNHIRLLVNALKSDRGFAWSFSDVKLSFVNFNNKSLKYLGFDYPFKQNAFALEQLFKSNFIPLNSYLLDTEKIEQNMLFFDESFTFAEDYVLILKLASQYVPSYVQEVTCEYRIFQDCTNTTTIMNAIKNQPDKNKIRNWSKALWRIEKLKKELMPSYSTGLISLEFRKYVFYKFPELKILLEYKLPKLRRFLISVFNISQ